MKTVIYIYIFIIVYGCTKPDAEEQKDNSTYTCKDENIFLQNKLGHLLPDSLPPIDIDQDYWGITFYDSTLFRCDAIRNAFICNGLPDSLKNAAFISPYTNKVLFDAQLTKVSSTQDTTRSYLGLDIKNIRRCTYNCFLDSKVKYFHMRHESGAKLKAATYIIQSETELQALTDTTAYYPAEPIDFSKTVLIGFNFSSSGCVSDQYNEMIENIGIDKYKYKLEVVEVCSCRPLFVRQWWILVDRNSPGAKWEVYFSKRYLEDN